MDKHAYTIIAFLRGFFKPFTEKILFFSALFPKDFRRLNLWGNPMKNQENFFCIILTEWGRCGIIKDNQAISERSKDMAKFSVSTDSTCDLKSAFVKERDIWFVPLTFTMEKDGAIEEYLDNFSSDDEYVAFYEKVSAGYFPRTAKLNYDAHMQHFTAMAKAGVKEVVHFMISSGLANTITITLQAAEDIKKEYPDFTVYAVDPLSATVGQGVLVELAADCRDKGMSAKETYDLLMEVRNRVQHCIVPNDLFYLKKGGRVSAVSAAFGTMLNIKPMLSFDVEGKLKVLEKCKGIFEILHKQMSLAFQRYLRQW